MSSIKSYPSGKTKMEEILLTKEPPTITTLLMKKVGKKMGLKDEVIREIINPQRIIIFKLSCSILGKFPIVWGCISLHNNAKGPYKGGIRLAEDVDIWETVELSRLMTLKTAISDIEFGGGKTGIRVNWKELYKTFRKKPLDRKFEKIVKMDIITSYAHLFRDLFISHTYIPAPDMGTGPDEMTFIYNETLDPASVTGKPEGIHGWLPGRKESTGYGCAFITKKVAKDILKTRLENLKVAIQGFGNVGQPLALYLFESGIKIIGITDLYGGVYDVDGLNIPRLITHAVKNGTVRGFKEAKHITNEDLFKLDVDILIPAACSHVIDKNNASKIRAKLIVEAANMPITPEGMEILKRRKIKVIPGILANSGGVIASMEEYASSLSAIKMEKEKVFKIIESKIGNNMELITQISEKEKVDYVESAVMIAMDRVYKAMLHRKFLGEVRG